MSFRHRSEKDIVIFSLSGKIMSCEDAVPIRDQVKDYIDHGRRKFVIDMSDVPWINSEGIGLLAMTMATIKGADGKMVLASVNEKVEKVLTITKLDSLLKQCENCEAAIHIKHGQPSNINSKPISPPIWSYTGVF